MIISRAFNPSDTLLSEEELQLDLSPFPRDLLIFNPSDTLPSEEQLQFDPPPFPTGNEEIDLLNKQVATKKHREIKPWTEKECNTLKEIIQDNPTLHRSEIIWFAHGILSRTKASIRDYIQNQGWLTLKQQAESNATPSPTGNEPISHSPNKQAATVSNAPPKKSLKIKHWTEKENNTLKQIIQDNPALRRYKIVRLAQGSLQRTKDSIEAQIYRRKLMDK